MKESFFQRSLSDAQSISGFLSETMPLMEQVDTLPLETAEKLYDTFETAAKTVTANINTIVPELRVRLCDRQDKLLERIVDLRQVDGQLSGERPSHIYTPCFGGVYRQWSNVELMKDAGVTGYLLAREIGARLVMYFGTKADDYPHLSILPELEVLCQGPAEMPAELFSNADYNKQMANAYYSHLSEHYSKMDVLFMYGMYQESIDFLNAYRKLRPDGKTYCALDLNRHWMGRISWDSPPVKRFAAQSDLIATSCRSLRDALNRNSAVHFSCRWFPPGFFNPTGVKTIADAERKENVILTVGRIGTAQKNNAELLVAFARVSTYLRGWKLRLVGSIEANFQPVIEQFFAQRPDLKNRVVFTGAIVDKVELYKEYARAKIFALSSTVEGFPNVYAEGLFHGCMFVTSDIDAADDMTDFGRLGIKYKLGDIDALSSALLKLCSQANKRALQKEHIPKALDYAKKYFDWNRNAKKLAYMLYKNQLDASCLSACSYGDK